MAQKRKPKKVTSKTHRIKTRTSSGDLVEIQISARLKRVPAGVKLSKKLIHDMVKRKAESSAGTWGKGGRVIGAKEGKDPKGVELKIIAWRNAERKSRSDRTWRRTGSQAERWGSLRRALARA